MRRHALPVLTATATPILESSAHTLPAFRIIAELNSSITLTVGEDTAGVHHRNGFGKQREHEPEGKGRFRRI